MNLPTANDSALFIEALTFLEKFLDKQKSGKFLPL
jgi:hypothetical protein